MTRRPTDSSDERTRHRVEIPGVEPGDSLNGDQIQALLETSRRQDVESDATGNRSHAPGSADDEDDEIELDARGERFGYIAGGASTVVILLLLFVGPWRLIDVTFSGGFLPFTFRESPETPITLVAPVIITFFGMVTGSYYRATTTDLPDDYRMGIALNTVIVPVVVGAILYVLLLLVPAGMMLLEGEFVAAIIGVVLAFVIVWFFSLFELIGGLIYVGIPAFIGVYFGSLLGAIAAKAAGE